MMSDFLAFTIWLILIAALWSPAAVGGWLADVVRVYRAALEEKKE
jgi:hypothetical protein